MLECNRYAKKKMKKLLRTVLVALPVLCIVLLLTQTAFAKSTYVINDGDRVLIHSTYATDPAEILDEAGLTLGEDDTYTAQESEITVRRRQRITLSYGGKELQLQSYGETVSELLSRMNILLGADDVLSVPQETKTYDGMALVVYQATHREETYTTALPYETSYCYDASLAEGEQAVLIAGVDGQLLCTAKVYYVDGREVARTVLSQDVTRQPVDALVAIGTYTDQPQPVPMPTEPVPTEPAPTEPAPTEPAPTEAASAESVPAELATGMPVEGDGFITTATGEVLAYTRKLDVVATAYSCNGEPGITYSGTPARVGAIAVDPTVIPLGTRMYVVSNDGEYIYGEAVAEDIGGAIKGSKIDLYFNTFDECWIFGVRDCTVYILG